MTSNLNSMTLSKTFTATLFLSMLVTCVTVIFYSCDYSVVPRSLATSNDVIKKGSRSSDSTVKNSNVNEEKQEEFSTREFTQLQNVQESKIQTVEVYPINTKTEKTIVPSKIQNIKIENKNEQSERAALKKHSDQTANQLNGIQITSKNRNLSGSNSVQIRKKTDFNISTNKTTIQTTSVQRSQFNNQCEERINIVLLKTHKTGSSTVQNILYRFGDARRLSFVLPANDVYIGSPAYFSRKYILNIPGSYNILANHARFHKGNMAKLMPENTKYITILRLPSRQFQSMYSYYTFKNKFHTSLEEFSNNAKEFYTWYEGRHPKHSALNPSLYDLGLPKAKLANPTQIDRWIQYIDRSFDLVLIAEYLQESLILLKELMCWSLQDILYFSSNKRNESLIKKLSNKIDHQLLNWHKGDFRLYQHFNRTLHKKIEQYGIERMKRDVDLLNQRNKEMADMCLQGILPHKELHGRTIIDRYVLKPSAKKNVACSRMTYSAFDYLNILRHKQKLRRPKRKT